MTAALDIDTLDRLPPDEFGAAVAPLFEGAPRFLARLAEARPFRSDEALFDHALAIALAMPEEEQVELIDAHPRLGAPPQTVSVLSRAEQGYGSEASGATDDDEHRRRVAAELERLNEAYEQRFGFRYCVFVAGRSREALLPGMAASLAADRADEIRRALADVVAIARDRHRRLRTQVREA